MNPSDPPLPTRRMVLLGAGLLLVLAVFGYRLTELQAWRRDAFLSEGGSARTVRQELPAQRGMIQDVHGEILAAAVPTRKVVADCTRLTQPEAVAARLAGALSLNRAELRAKLAADPERAYLVLARQVPETVASQLQADLAAARLRGVFFEPDSQRVYPNGSLLCHVVGYTGFVSKEQHAESGVQGIEQSMDRYLRGEPGFRYIETDRTGAELVQHRGAEQAPRNGHTVRLTVDLGLQSIVEEELDAAVQKFHPDSVVAIMVRPKTGEILALANRPHFDLNRRAETTPEKMRNRAITDMVEPGSTFKIVTVSSALDARLVHPDTVVFCENGRWEYARNVLRDAHPFGNLSVHDILVHSSNIGAAKLGLQLGPNRLFRQIRSFGFGEATGVDLPGEIGGLLHPVSRWSNISITHIPMGHEVGVTPLQLVMAMGAVANGGNLMLPQIVHEITDEKNQPIADFPPVTVRRVLGPEAVRQVVAALEDVVGPHGTAKAAAVPGFRVAGKTGTAEKVNLRGGGYLHGKYVVSFLGFLPVENPEFVCLVLVDNAANTKVGGNWGGTVAAPVFAGIAARAARYLNLEPRPPLTPAPGPSPAALARQSFEPEEDRD